MLIISTLLLRPYVFIFLVCYLFIGFSQIGLTRTLIFTLLAYTLAFISEYSSTHNGFPYGYYTYIEATRGQELWIANVPFFDSLSYSFLAYLSYATGIFFYLSPRTFNSRNNKSFSLKESEPKLTNRLRRLSSSLEFPPSLRYSFKVLLLSTLLFVLIDVIVDPLALRGERWFLGHLYEYKEKGLYFNIPVSNFLGWFIVGFSIIGSFQLIDRKITQKWNFPPLFRLPYNLIYAPVLYFGVMLFNLTITFYIGEHLLGFCSTFIFTIVFTCFVIKLKKASKCQSVKVSERF